MPRTRPLIAIVCRRAETVDDPDVPLPRRNSYCIEKYLEAISKAGGLPILIPIVNGRHNDYAEFFAADCDGLLLPGGCDIVPREGEPTPADLGYTDPQIDSTDLALVWACVQHKIPVLGICRGMQVLNVAFGGTIQSLVGASKSLHDRHDLDRTAETHTLQVEQNTLLGDALLGAKITNPGTPRNNETVYVKSNSLHHQSVDKVPPPLVANCFAKEDPKKLVEGVEIAAESQGEYPWMLGVQCHPEELVERVEGWSNVFKRFVHECSLIRTQPRQKGSVEETELITTTTAV